MQIILEKTFFKPQKILTGSRRFSKLKQAASSGDLAPPVDIRYLAKPLSAQNSEAKSSASSFLMQVYESVAETLPDYRDETFDVDTTLVTLKEDITENKDPYAEQLDRGLGPNCHSPSQKVGPNAKNPKLRKKKNISNWIRSADQKQEVCMRRSGSPLGRWRTYGSNTGMQIKVQATRHSPLFGGYLDLISTSGSCSSQAVFRASFAKLSVSRWQFLVIFWVF